MVVAEGGPKATSDGTRFAWVITGRKNIIVVELWPMYSPTVTY